MKLSVHATTDIGLMRERNEDSFLVDVSHGIFAVADGVGGVPGGDAASQAAIAAIRAAIAENQERAVSDLNGLVQRAHGAVRNVGRVFGPNGICTTLTLLHARGNAAHIAHVGDSFALLVRDGRCRAITREHNVENERGEGYSLAMNRFALTRVLGQPDPLTIEFFEETLHSGDRVILATDGLTDMITFSEIATVVSRQSDPKRCACDLVTAALKAGGRDNITLIVVSVN